MCELSILSLGVLNVSNYQDHLCILLEEHTQIYVVKVIYYEAYHTNV
jgi:hypothetical protein